MKTATIIITDVDGDNVNVKVEFGEGGGDKESMAHQTALLAVRYLLDNANDGDNDE